ncbi:hypothetical protein Scep_000546 [Stephania cephalantha]|uniref:Fe2OG dioxygenase domain-containing protein n=1 Tax=Stephania cephalantha TaxID=152367 RepID=A0AAP0Q314_9MAGN
MARTEQNEIFFHEASFIDENGQPQTHKIPVIQELARQGIQHLPQCFVRPQHERPSPSLPYEGPFPTINMANLLDLEEPVHRPRELAKLARYAEEWGLFMLENHGIDKEVVRSVKDAVDGFFSLGFEEKKLSVGTYRSVDNLGYGRNYVKSRGQSLEWIDRLTVRVAPARDSEGLDVWPRKPLNFREVMEKYVNEARRVMDDILEALAEVLGLERLSFLKFFEPNESVINMRVNYYAPCPRPDLVLGINPHSDASALTFSLQSDTTTQGLQVLKNNKWVTVTWPNDTLLVMVGDLLEIMSNGRAQSAWHRVVTQKDVERFSVALFYNPPLRAQIGPVVGDGDEEVRNELNYKKVVVEDYVQNYYKVAPAKEKEDFIAFAKTNK